MTETHQGATRASKAALTALLLLVQAGSRAQNVPALAAPAAPVVAPEAKDAREGFPLSIASSSQGNIGKLGIGVGYVGGGPYLDEKGARQTGLHASLSISVEGQPKLFQQPDVREGQTLMAADYRIRVDKIEGSGSQGRVLLRVWAPAKPKASKSWLSRFGL